jgi:chorismate mutase
MTGDRTAKSRESALDALARWRHEIESIDHQIIDLLADRVAVSKEIGALKKVAGLPTLDPAREAEVIRRAAELARAQGLNDEKVRDIYWHIIGLSRGVQTAE